MRQGEVFLKDPVQWKAIGHPTRIAILKALEGKEMTNKELADTLGMASGKLHFHTRTLLEAGLIERAGTREKGPLTEKLYRCVGKGFYVEPIQDGSAPPLQHIIEIGHQMYLANWERSEGRPFSQHGFHLLKTLLPEDEKEVYRRIVDLIKFIDKKSVEDGTLGAKSISVSALAHEMIDKP